MDSYLRFGCLDFVLCMWLSLGLFAGVSSLSCPYQYPCNQTVDCAHISLAACQYGLTMDACFCCMVCAKGEGQPCGNLQGNCGDGLMCVYPPWLLPPDRLHYPGTCRPVVATTSVSTSVSTTDVATSLSAGTTASTTEHNNPPADTTNTQPPTSTTATTESAATNNVACAQQANGQQASTASFRLEKCRADCSVSFCSGSKHRICSAKGMAFSKVVARGGCQHTSCRACFLHVESPCSNFMCPEPPTKRCLQKYYKCVRDHVLSPDPHILNLDDPVASNHSGRIICHVPEIIQSMS